jgi:hypothetical protein
VFVLAVATVCALAGVSRDIRNCPVAAMRSAH